MPVRRSFPSVVVPALFVLLGLALTAPRVVAAPLFSAPFLSYDLGPGNTVPIAVAIGDLNGDGRPDLVTTNLLGGGSVLLRLAGDTYGPHMEFPTAGISRSVAIADLNGDGKLDLVTANTQASGVGWLATVSVLLGKGDGTFEPNHEFATGTAPWSVAIGDVTGDGKLDIVTANGVGNSVSVLPGHGDGNFDPHSDFDTGVWPQSIAIADVSGDTKLDIVTANFNNWAPQGSVSVLLRNASGSFDRTDYTIGGGPQSVAIADLDADGWPDLVTANSLSDSVTVLAGSGAGTFGVRSDFFAGDTPCSVAIRDLNNDGGPDIVTADNSNAGLYSVSVLRRNVDGSYAAPTHFEVGSGPPLAVAIGDLDGDGRPDLVTANYGGANTVSVLLGNGNGSFGAQPHDFPVGGDPLAVAIRDLDANGWPDVVTANWASDNVTVLAGTGGGSFGVRSDFGTGHRPSSVAIGDLNNDSGPDIATTGEASTVSVLFRNVDGSYTAPTDLATGGPGRAVAIGDLNGDLKPDLVTANWDGGYGPSTVSVLLGEGGGAFDAHNDFPAGFSPYSGVGAVAIGDLNHDDNPDLVTTIGNGGVSVLLGDGHGALGAQTPYGGLGGTSVAIGDVNGDGHPDLVAPGNPLGVSVMFGNGDGTFGAIANFATGNNAFSAAIGDLNGDGKPDLVTTNPSANTVSVLLGDGHGHFGLHTDYGVESIPFSRVWAVAIADINADGRPDLVTTSIEGSSNMVSVLFNTGADAPILGVKPPSPPRQLSLSAPRPNPFRGRALYEFSVPATEQVRLEIYDVQGRSVRTLEDGVLAPNHYTRVWDGTTTTGRAAQPGLYFVRLTAPGVELKAKTVLVR